MSGVASIRPAADDAEGVALLFRAYARKLATRPEDRATTIRQMTASALRLHVEMGGADDAAELAAQIVGETKGTGS